jgi:uncharacterized Fe-S cluster protein YjdI
MHEYKGTKVIVRYDEKVCTHAAKCVNGLPAVFDINKTPWVNPDGSDAEAVKRQVAQCPSGALSCEEVS